MLQKDCLQNSLCESDARFGTELAQMQILIRDVEEWFTTQVGISARGRPGPLAPCGP